MKLKLHLSLIVQQTSKHTTHSAPIRSLPIHFPLSLCLSVSLFLARSTFCLMPNVAPFCCLLLLLPRPAFHAAHPFETKRKMIHCVLWMQVILFFASLALALALALFLIFCCFLFSFAHNFSFHSLAYPIWIVATKRNCKYISLQDIQRHLRMSLRCSFSENAKWFWWNLRTS